MKRKKVRVLLIEDNKFDQMAFVRMLEKEKLCYDYTIAACVAEARKMAESKVFDVVISDYYLGDGTLFDIIDLVKNAPIIITTGVGSEEVVIKAMQEGAFDYLIKDLDRNYLKVLPVTIENAIKHKRSEEKSCMLSHAIMCVNECVYITDVNDRIIFVNKVFCKTYGYPEDEIIGKPSTVLWKNKSLNNEDVKNILTKIDEFGWKSQLYHQRKDGSELLISISRSIIKDDKENEVAVVGVVHEISEDKPAPGKLNKTPKTAAAASHSHAEEVVNLGHHMRARMNTILEVMKLLSGTELTPQQRDYVKVLNFSSEAVANSLDRISDLFNSKSELVNN